MDSNKKAFYAVQAAGIIKKLRQRSMEGYYCPDVASAREQLKELLGSEKKTVSYGGSMTIDENGFKEVVKENGHDLIIREAAGNTPEAERELKARMFNSDTFLMSTNAITLDGELINIDGRGTRVCYLIYGPEEVIIIAGMNKVVPDIESGLARVRNIAAPPNCIRLHRETPCVTTGRCGNCLNDTICDQIVITRASRVPGRIKVILIGEELGY